MVKTLNLRDFNFTADLHCFAFEDMRLVLDVVSGAVHLVDQPTWDLLVALRRHGGEMDSALAALKANYSEALLDEVIAEIGRLVEEGLLFTPDPWRKVGDAPISSAPPVIKSLCLHLAHDCNLRCRYCFGGGGGFGGSRSLMSVEVGRAAIDFLLRHSGSRRHCEVDFFGGEPLLNLKAAKDIIDYARRRGEEQGKIFQFTLTTNAVLLDWETREYLNQQGVSLVLSLDGRPEVHDRMRTYADGSGSWEEALNNARALAKERNHDNYYVRGTYTRHNLDFAADVLFLAEQGFRYISVEPVVAPEQEDFALREKDLPVVMAEYDKLAAVCRESNRQGGFKFFHFEVDLEHGPCLPKRVKGCGAGIEYLAVTPEGDLYPCHQFVGRPGYLMGNVLNPRQVLDLALVEKFQQASLFRKPSCANCWARYYCGGGCHANADFFNQSLLKPYELGCRLQTRRIEAAIYLQACAILDRGEPVETCKDV